MRIRTEPVFAPGSLLESLGTVTLDRLFESRAERHADAPFLFDPPDLEAIAGLVPETLTWNETEERVQRFSRALRRVGLRRDDVVAVRIPNCAALIVTLLAIWRAGLIAAPVPLFWRERDLDPAIDALTPKALITTPLVDGEPGADLARDLAARCFSIRFLFNHGDAAADGVIALEPMLALERERDDLAEAPAPREDESQHVALLGTMETHEGLTVVPRCHGALIAAGFPVWTALQPPTGTTLVQSLQASGLAGLATGLVPSLLSGSSLHLLHAPACTTLRAVTSVHASPRLVVPGAMLTMLGEASGIAVHAYGLGPGRTGDMGGTGNTNMAGWRHFGAFGELAVLPLLHTENGFALKPGPVAAGARRVEQGEIGRIALALPNDAENLSFRLKPVATVPMVSGGTAPDGVSAAEAGAMEQKPGDSGHPLPVVGEKRSDGAFEITGIAHGLGLVGNALFDATRREADIGKAMDMDAAAFAVDRDFIALAVVPRGNTAPSAADAAEAFAEFGFPAHLAPNAILTVTALPRRGDGSVDRTTILRKVDRGT